MTLDEFITHEIEQLNKFKTFWEEATSKYPKAFPPEFDHPEWQEQFAAYQSAEEDGTLP